MATQCRSSKCTAERKGFRRELDSWRHKLVHCVGFESILEGIYGPRLLRDLSIFDDCEPDAVSDWSVDASCSFCNLQLEKLSDHIPPVSSPQSPPTEETPPPPPQGQSNTENIECQADRFLHAIFRKKDLPQSCDPNIPLVAQELMKKMIRQFAIEYASKSQIEGAKNHTSNNLPHPPDEDGPLDLTVNRHQPNVEQVIPNVPMAHPTVQTAEPLLLKTSEIIRFPTGSSCTDGVLDLSKKNCASSALSTSSNQKASGRPQKDDYVGRSSEFSEGLLSKALKDVESGSLDVHKAAVLYGIPQKTLRLQLEASAEGRLEDGEDLLSKSRETHLVLQKVAAWARAHGERAELGKLGLAENSELKFPAASTYLHQLTLQRMVSQLREKSESLYFESSNNPAVRLKIPQVRISSVPKSQADISSLVDIMYQVSKATSTPEASALQKLKTILPKQNKMDCSVPLLHSGIESCLMQADLSPLCLNLKNGSVDDAADDLDRKDKQPRKKRGRYRQYDHDILEEAISMVMGGKMSVSKAQGIYGVPHSTLEYKVKERSGTLKSVAQLDSFTVHELSPGPADDVQVHLDAREEKSEARSSTLETVLSSLCPYHKTLLYQILKCMREYYSTSSAHRYKNAHGLFAQTDGPLCCHLSGNLHRDLCGFGDYKVSNGCYVPTCRVNSLPVAPVCICLKNFHCLSCQSIAIGCINGVVGPSSCGCYPRHHRIPCSCQNYIDGAYVTPVGNVASAPFGPQHVRDPYRSCTKGGCSPSPPPLSPIPSDVSGKISDKTFVCSFADGKTCSSQPPSLFPFEEEGDALSHKDCLSKGKDVSEEETGSQKDNDKGTDCCTETCRCLEQRQSGTIIHDLMERINEKLKTIEPLEKQQNIITTVNKSLECSDDVHVGKITTTVLHNDSDHDYTIKELPCQPKAIVENKPMQTPFCRGQITENHNLLCLEFPSSSCQSEERKQSLSNLSQSLERRKETLEESRNPNVRIEEDIHFSGFQPIPNRSDVEGVSEDVDIEITKDICDNQISKGVNTELPLCTPENTGDAQKIEDRTAEDCAISMNGLPLGSPEPSTEKQAFPPRSSNCSDLGRSRRNIVPPARFSSYVTEPRKMYFAACFSESFFIPRASKDKALKGTDSENSSPEMERDESSTEPVIREPSDTASNIKKLDEDEQDLDKPNEIKLVTTTSRTRNQSILAGEKTVEESGTKWVSPRRTKRHEVSRSHARSKSSDTHSDDPDPRMQSNDSPEDTHTIENPSVSSECHSVPQYTSPIRLMFVCPVACENGIRYTLKSAFPGSTNDGETFDPCEESSWGGTINTPVKETAPRESCVTRDENGLHKRPVATDDASRADPLKDSQENEKEVCPIVPEIASSPLKRKPGRPKKLGPQIEKRAKRPIGRPPKLKDTNSTCSDDKGNTKSINDDPAAILCEDKDARTNKNLKITVVYGRSRRIKRLVSEDDGSLRKDQTEHQDDGRQKCDLNGNVLALSANDSSEKLPEEQAKNFNFVGPMNDRKCLPPPSTELKCQKQKRCVAMRKPGRPPKVKISGISVTVTTVSPKQRKIRINGEITESDREQSQLESTVILDDKPSKEQTTISSDATHEETTQNMEDGRMSKKTPVVPLRHSARERKPSIHLLHSVATSRTFSHSNALLRRSRKLLLNKANSEPNQIKSPEKSTGEAPVIPERASRNRRGQDLSFLSGISADSIFASNEALKWWPTSASYETLNEELTRRIQLMSDTWIADAVVSSKSCPTERETDLRERTCSAANDLPKNSVSAVKMLFQKHCNMEDLCAWFMQTTETQSLAIVRKASARNPYEIIQFNPNRVSKRGNVCPSPQAERLRKHVKKFAKIVPKSPVMHLQAQERISRSGRLHVKRRLFPKRSSAIAGVAHTWCLWSRGKPFSKYQSTLLRVKSKFMTRKRLAKATERRSDRASSGALRKNAATPAKVSLLQVCRASSVDTGCRSPSSSILGERESAAQQVQSSKGTTRCGSQEWSPGTMRECRVFLKKINSPETKPTVEECNSCTVQLRDISSSDCGLPASTDRGEGKTEPVKPENVRNERVRRTTRKVSSQYPEELWVQTTERKGKRKSSDLSQAQPAKKGKTI